MYKPEVIVLDFETALTNGQPSTEYYRDDFRAVSAAFAWRGKDGTLKTKYTEGEADTGERLTKIADAGIPVIVHNFQFEFGVLAHRFPGLESVVAIDTMRLVQVADNGGKMYHGTVKPQTYDDILDAAENGGETSDYRAGLGLVVAASRFLPPERQNHKEPFHAWLRENAGVKKGHEGRNLDKLPAAMFEAYNVADAEVTLLLYEALVQKFVDEKYDWRLDHELYKSSARMIAIAKGHGLPVNRLVLEAYVQDIEAEIAQIEADFRAKFLPQIEDLEWHRCDAYVQGLKSDKGRARRLAEVQEHGTPEELRFNVGSNLQLRALFVDKLGIRPQFWTKEPKRKPGQERKKEFVPSPSFKAAHLSTYGEGGTMLRQRRKRMLVLSQAKALLGLSRYDNKWHFDIKACGTATGRFAGGKA